MKNQESKPLEASWAPDILSRRKTQAAAIMTAGDAGPISVGKNSNLQDGVIVRTMRASPRGSRYVFLQGGDPVSGMLYPETLPRETGRP